MSGRDHADIHAWISTSTYSHVAFEASMDPQNPDLGDFFLIYRANATWSSWGIGCSGTGFLVWQAVTTDTLGWYPDIVSGLAAIPPATGLGKPRRDAGNAVRATTTLPTPIETITKAALPQTYPMILQPTGSSVG